MIEFQKIDPANRAAYDQYLLTSGKGCEYSFSNIAIWGRQRAAFLDGFLVENRLPCSQSAVCYC